jgi:hypothetical protein
MTDPGTDALSPLAWQIIKARPDAYQKLVVTGRVPAEARKLLDSILPAQLLAVPIASSAAAHAMLAGLWLWHDGLDECHKIAQQSPQHLAEMATTLHFWHAVMHRREGDFSNSQYWYAKCRDHPVITAMGPHASQIVHPMPADKHLLRMISQGWDADAFVDLVQAIHDHPTDPRHEVARSLQQMEWRLLFDHCTRAAVGK